MRFSTFKPGTQVAIDYGHPLAEDISACFLFNEGGGPFRDLVSRYSISVQGSGVRGKFNFGDGLDCRGADSGASGTAWAKVKGGVPKTILWCGRIYSNPSHFGNLAGVSYDNGLISPYHAYELGLDDASPPAGYSFSWNNSGSAGLHTQTGAVAFDGTERQVVSVVSVAATGGATSFVEIWENKNRLSHAGSQTANLTYGTTPKIEIGTDPFGLGRDSKSICRHAYFFNRVLGANEIEWLWAEPYAFLVTKTSRTITVGSGASNIEVAVSDTLSLLEAIEILGLDPFLQADITNALSLSDSMSLIADAPKEFSDAVSLSDAIQVDVPTQISQSDTLALSDAVVLDFVVKVLITDLLQLTDHVHTALDQKLELLVQDSLVLTDDPQTAAAWRATLSDALVLSDSIVTSRELAFSDAFSDLSDAVTVLLESIFTDIQRTASDQLDLFDSIQLAVTIEGYLFGDSLPLGDSVDVVLNSNITDYLRRYLNDVPR